MWQAESFTSFLAIIMIAEFLLSVSFIQVVAQSQQKEKVNFEYDTRPNDIGLNGFYTAEYKRLPVYDFGLGKRLDSDEIFDSPKEYDDYMNVGNRDEDDNESLPELELYHDDNMQRVDKRPHPYNFGLGKRQRYDFGLGKRGHRTYDFGLGKRAASSRNKMYNMGLGKRTRQYSFGLGKRPFSPGSMSSRFNFGLGKRSENLMNKVMKRNVQRKRANLKNAEIGSDNETDDIYQESLKPDSDRLAKRSSYFYPSGIDDVDHRSADEFLRQFRNPLYNFGLGKRTYLLKSDKLRSPDN